MASWREQRAEKERVEKEREEAAAAAKKEKLAGLSTASSSAPSTVCINATRVPLSKLAQYPAIPSRRRPNFAFFQISIFSQRSCASMHHSTNINDSTW